MTEDPIVDAAPVAAAAPPAAPEAPPPVRELTVSQRSMALVKSSLKEFDAVEAGLAKLRKKYENVVFDVSTTKGMKQATEARMAIREPRYAVKAALDAAKKPLNELKADVTARAEAITAEIMKLETPIHEQIQAEEKRKADEKEAREAANRARVLDITERISAMRQMVARAGECRTAERVSIILEGLKAVSLEGMDEFDGEARRVHAEGVASIESILAVKQADEREREERRLAQAAEEQRLAEERAELERQRQEQAERERVAAAALAEQQAALAREREEFEALQRAAAPAPAPAPAEAIAPPENTRDEENGDSRGSVIEPAPTAPTCHESAQGAQGAPAQDDIVDAEVTAEVLAGFDVAMKGPPAFVPLLAGTEPTDDEIMEVAIDAVAGYFGITEAEAMNRLCSIETWLYRGEALAA